MKLLFLNTLKGLRRRKIQMLAIIVMVALSTGIYTVLNSAIDRMENRYYDYLEEGNVEEFSLVPVIDYKNDYTVSDLDRFRKNNPNISSEENQMLDMYNMCLSGYKLCDDNFYSYIGQIFRKYDFDTKVARQKLDSIKDKYNFDYEYQKSKVVNDDKYYIKAMPYIKNKKINKPYLVDGKFPTKNNEVTVLPKFAKKNNLKIGDKYKINNKIYRIVGFAYASDYIYPMISYNQPIFDEKYNNIVFMNESTYEDFSGIKDDVYAMVFKEKVNRKNRIKVSFSNSADVNKKKKMTLEEAKRLKDYSEVINIMLEDEKDIVSFDINSIIRVARTDAIQLEFDSDRVFADAFLKLLLSIAVIIIVIITKKRIEDERLQIGVLKSLGYSKYSIAVSYLVYPIIGSLVGGLLGYLIGISLHGYLTVLYISYFNIPLASFTFNKTYLINSVVTPLIFLSILCYLVALWMLRKKPLQLLKEGSNLKVNFMSKIINKITKPMKFKRRFKYSLMSRSIGKLLIVSITSFFTGMLIVLTIIGLNLFNGMIEKSFANMKYKYMINYAIPVNKIDKNSDVLSVSSMNLAKINNKTYKKKNEKDYTITLDGIDKKTKYVEVMDSEKNNLLDSLYTKENGIVINKNIEGYLKVKVGDILTLDYNGKEYDFVITGVCDEYINESGYVSRSYLNKLMGYDSNSYNVKYTTSEKYSSLSKVNKEERSSISSIFSVDDLKRNINTQMETMNSSIYIVIFFAAIMALIIIGVIANIIVEENKKTISLMKVMGYDNKEISSIVLNIYTPFVIVSYLLSIPVMTNLLKLIMKAIAGDTGMSIPISISPALAMLGLVVLLIAYFVAISISRVVLNKVPLSVALKRE